MKLFTFTAQKHEFDECGLEKKSVIAEYGTRQEMTNLLSPLFAPVDSSGVRYSDFCVREATKIELDAFIENKEHQILKALGDIEQHLSSAESLKAVVENLKATVAAYSAPEEESEASLRARVEELEKENARLRSLCEAKSNMQKMSESMQILSARRR